MNQFFFYIAIATSIVLAVQVYKNLWAGICSFVAAPKLTNAPVGYVFPILLGYWAIFSLGSGLLGWLGIEYVNSVFKWFDLFTTGALVAGGSNTLYDWLQAVVDAKKHEASTATGTSDSQL